MRLKLLLAWVLTSMGIFSSCVSITDLSVDTLIPADVTFPATVKNVAVVNNMEPGRNEVVNRSELRVNLTPDSAALVKRIAEDLANANYFDKVMICDSVMRHENGLPAVLSPMTVGSMSDGLGVDLLVSIDNAQIKTARKWLYTEYSGNSKAPVLQTAIMLESRLYLPGRDRVFQRFVDRDTLYWEPADGIPRDLIEASVAAMSQKLADHIVPYWDTERRYYFNGGSVNLRDGAVAVREKDWDEAFQSWKSEYQQKKGVAKMRAAYNLALYHEMKGETEQAVKYAKEALDFIEKNAQKKKEKDGNVSLKDSEQWLMAHSYLNKLYEKQQQQKKLDLQMQRFNP